jgi:hypothetical protein
MTVWEWFLRNNGFLFILHGVVMYYDMTLGEGAGPLIGARKDVVLTKINAIMECK